MNIFKYLIIYLICVVLAYGVFIGDFRTHDAQESFCMDSDDYSVAVALAVTPIGWPAAVFVEAGNILAGSPVWALHDTKRCSTLSGD